MHFPLAFFQEICTVPELWLLTAPDSPLRDVYALVLSCGGIIDFSYRCFSIGIRTHPDSQVAHNPCAELRIPFRFTENGLSSPNGEPVSMKIPGERKIRFSEGQKKYMMIRALFSNAFREMLFPERFTGDRQKNMDSFGKPWSGGCPADRHPWHGLLLAADDYVRSLV